MNSINNQTYLNYEVLLVNDGSTDKSANVIAEYITGKKNWFLFSKQNAGPSATRNFGIDHSKGEYLAFVDADDFIEPMYLEKLYEGIIKNKSDLTCCGYYDHSKHGVLSLNNYKNRIGDFVNVKEFTELIFTQIGGVLWDKLFIASIIKKHKVYMDEDIFFSEDVLFILEYFKYTNSISVISDPLYNYNRLNESGISKKINNSYKQNIINVSKRIRIKLSELYFSQSEIKEIIGKKIFFFVFTIASTINHSKIRTKEKTNILDDVLNDPYIVESYSEQQVSSIYKPYLFFIKHRQFKCIILYSYLLDKTKKVFKK